MNLSLNDIAIMCGGELSTDSNKNQMVTSVVIDSRNVTPNSLFVAIKGENHDGHSYVENCLKSGAVAALVNSNCSINHPNLIKVTDTVKALGQLSHNYRIKFEIPVIGITGSNGKTTVKEMLKSICEREYGADKVLATTGNLNNFIGMPLTLLRLNKEHKVAIIEMGMNHAGELRYLSGLASPTVAVVNNVMLAHAGFFKDLTDIANAKGEIYSGLVPGGIACINKNLPYADSWYQENVKNQDFGIPGSICFQKENIDLNKFIISTIYGDIECKLQVLGKHNQQNAVTAATLALVSGCSLSSIKDGLESYLGYKGRLERKTAFNGALIIDDSYNANPDSVKAAILAIKDLPKPHWFIFADLKELGAFSQKSHEEIATFANLNGVDCLLTLGDESKITHSLFQGHKMHFERLEDIVEYCKQSLPNKATLLVKGSNSMNLALVVEKLIK